MSGKKGERERREENEERNNRVIHCNQTCSSRERRMQLLVIARALSVNVAAAHRENASLGDAINGAADPGLERCCSILTVMSIPLTCAATLVSVAMDSVDISPYRSSKCVSSATPSRADRAKSSMTFVRGF